LAGIDFINDSKATNYDAAQVGLASVNSPAILIAGGEAKAGDDSSWIQTIQAKVAVVLLIVMQLLLCPAIRAGWVFELRNCGNNGAGCAQSS